MKSIYQVICLIGLFALSVLPVHADPAIFTQNNYWSIYKNSDGKGCFAYQNISRSYAIGIAADQNGVGFSIFDKRLGWLNVGSTYNAAFFIDRSRWDGRMNAARLQDISGLTINSVNSKFIMAFRRGKQMQLVVNNQIYGPYPLKGTAKVMDDLEHCVNSFTSETAKNAPQAKKSNAINLYEGGREEWTFDVLPRFYDYNGLQIAIRSVPSQDNGREINIEISQAGSQPVRFTQTAISGEIMVRKFQQNETAKVIISAFSGGAHCCSQVYVVNLIGNSIDLIDVGSHDGDMVLLKDIDQDGLFEFTFPDERFSVFSSYMDSFPPMTILSIENGELKDVTRAGRFLHYHEVLFQRQSEICNNNAKINTGACSGLLGTASILGIFDAALETMDFDNNAGEPDKGKSARPYRICANENCSQSNTFDNEKSAIIEAIRVWNYEPEAYKENAELAEFVKRLIGKKFADEKEQTEMSCEIGPAQFEILKGPRDHPLYSFSNYETGCVFDRATIVGNSVLAKTVCTGEAEPMWIENHIYAYDGENFSLASFDNTAFDRLHVIKTKACGK